MGTEICQRCKEEGEDRRTLWMACLYQMNELGLPFQMQTMRWDVPHQLGKYNSDFYTLRVCKDCRSDWMESIQAWFNRPIKKEDGVGSGIYVRRLGRAIEITEDEWRTLNASKTDSTGCKADSTNTDQNS